MKRSLATLIVWTAALAALLGAGILASVFALMATSLDPVQAINAGVAPWLDALYAGLAFLAVAAATVVALFAWHSRRFRWLGAGIAGVEVALVIWAGLAVYAEYF